MIVFDEPTTSLTSIRDRTAWKRIEALRDAGNTVVLIEHNRRLWTRADWLIELGPRAGEYGGEVLWEGPGKDAPSGQSDPETSGLSAQMVRTDRLINLRPQGLRNVEALNVEIPVGCVVSIQGSPEAESLRWLSICSVKLSFGRTATSPETYLRQFELFVTSSVVIVTQPLRPLLEF